MTAYQKRQDRLRQALADLGANGMLVTNLTNVRYLSGFTGSAGMLVLLPDDQHFISDGRYQEQARLQVADFQLHIDTGGATNQPLDGLFGFLGNLNLLGRGQRLAFEARQVSVSQFHSWPILFPKVEWVESDSVVEQLSAVKDADELSAIREAVRITDLIFEEIKNDCRAGTTERDVAARITYLAKTMAEGDSFEPIVASGWRGALPHARPSDKEFERGDFVVLDFGALYGGYHADMTRTICIAEAHDKHQNIYGIVAEAQRRGIAAVRAGVPTAQVDAVCRSYIAGKGYGEYFIHSTGHGLGLEVHTMPRLSQTSTETLEEGMVVTIEPGIYLRDWGGVRIEDDVLVGPDSCTPLNQATKELLVLG